MPILTSPPAADEPVVSHRIPAQRSGEAREVGPVAPSPLGVLLPSGGSDHHARTSVDRTWGSAAFQRRVAAVHRQLAPVSSRAALVESYGREASQGSSRSHAARRRSATALQVAYALRWFELDGSDRGAITWAELLDAPTG